MSQQAWIVLGLFLLMIAYRLWQRRGVEYTSVHEVKARLDARDKITIVDVRQPWEYKMGHLPGAVNIPLGDLKAGVAEFDPNQEICLVCRSGARGITGYKRLKKLGFANVKNMEGGMMRWPWPPQKQS